MKRIVIVISIIAFIMSCSNGNKNSSENKKVASETEVFKNTLEPADPDLKIIPELIITINDIAEDSTENFQRLQMISVSDDGSIYAGDAGTFSIRKFNTEGKLVTKFGKQGKGPGEFSMFNVGFAAGKNKVYVPDPMTQSVNVFDTDGNFIEKVNTMSKGIGMMTMPVVMTSDDILSYVTQVEQKDGKIILKNSLKILSDNFDEKKKIWGKDIDFDPTDMSKMMTMGNDFPSIAFNDREIFVAKSGLDDFEIVAYDLSGNEKYKIHSPYRKVKYTEKELEMANERIQSFGDENVKQFMKDVKFEETYKKVISGMYFDGAGRLWVAKAQEIKDGDDIELVKLEIFKDGIYQNTIELRDSEGNMITGMIQIKGNRIYSTDTESNSVKIYDF